MPEMTRAEHMKWCKERAMQEFDYYIPKEGMESAARNASVSMLSDLGKHPETAPSQSVGAMLLLGTQMRSRDDVKRFIDGFN